MPRRCEEWGAQWELRRPCIIAFKIRCLVLMAKDMNWAERNQAWVTTGTLVKQAMAAGFHREVRPDRSQESVYFSEMKRRIWATIVELDLRASLDRGMQPTILADSYDCEPPSNIDDRDLRETATAFPKARPPEVATDSSYQTVLSRSLPLRLHICALVNAPRFKVSADELIDLDAELTQFIAEVPHWKDDLDSDSVEKQEHMLARLHIVGVLRRFQLALHGAVILGKCQGSVYSHSWSSRFEAAATLLYEQNYMMQKLGRVAWAEISENSLHAILTVCHHLYSQHDGSPRSSAGYGGPYASSTLLTRIIPTAAESIMTLVDVNLSHFAERSLFTTKKGREYVFVGLVTTLVKQRLWPQCATVVEKQWTDEFIRAANRYLTALTIDTPEDAKDDPRAAVHAADGAGHPHGHGQAATATCLDQSAMQNPFVSSEMAGMEFATNWLDLFITDDDMLLNGFFGLNDPCATPAVRSDRWATAEW
ncbi:hypothetical protein KEM52_000626 [Ascosphaera acerosa]|nr:hypothetical protein KEM52_000626 [Ascosphaera acerosa]